MVFITTDGFLGDQGKKNEECLVDNAVRMVREGANDLALQLRVKDAGKETRSYVIARGEKKTRLFFFFMFIFFSRFFNIMLFLSCLFL